MYIRVLRVFARARNNTFGNTLEQVCLPKNIALIGQFTWPCTAATIFENKWCSRQVRKHVDKGCLSDPPTDLVNIFRRNSKKDVCNVARGTNTNEQDNWDLGHKILCVTHIGIHRADRLMSSFFESKN